MAEPSSVLKIIPLAPNAALPQPAPARTRASIPPGYGVQEQCLPFTAASALGFLIPSPIRFGHCLPEQLPAGCRAFRSPLNNPLPNGAYLDPFVFYVFDNPACRFAGNAFTFEGVSASGSSGVQEPGISFFDRPDQLDLIKLHLPYIWRTPESVDTVFLPLLNRRIHAFDVKCGLVETDWYDSPVNLALGIPRAPFHVAIGDIIAQALLLPRSARRPALEVIGEDSQLNKEARRKLAAWDRQHAENHSAYKVLARSAHGRLTRDTPPAS